ncbi:uncharacterized membrane protein (UPF0127 family) [Natronocella acetinitrilica]|uniref:Uncharacterized membrane protein (UPF0127 family) n=1 Tax=Natronocella acetinitrilica TaxID=414046 RepID=A0AAE3G6X2_9GAMM|nr:DUF192 domain-containing protein [Natronocella acetinitrilica]MCP1675881.1 uncharacterized membrane protein (UPF0127 family) [Natronocella acetinitrilica]
MSQRLGVWAFVLLSGLMLLTGHLFGQTTPACKAETPPLAGMEWQTIAFLADDGQAAAELRVRVARTQGQRAAGMQHLCPESIEENPMLFVFPSPQRPAFHMNNVHAPLDMVFIDPDGRVMELHLMEPGNSLTSPSAPISHALELAAGQAADLGIVPGMRLHWRAEH